MRTSPPKLLVHAPKKPPKEYLFKQPETVIGRDPSCQLPLDDRKVSRTHARLLDRQGRFTIRDLGSRNGTYVNDHRIGPEDGEVAIGDRDRIRIGNHIIRCVLPGVPSSLRPAGAREGDTARMTASVREQLLEPPRESRVVEEDVEWPPSPDASPGDELETGVIKRRRVPEPPAEAESVDLDLRPSELEAIREQAPSEEEAAEPAEGSPPGPAEASPPEPAKVEPEKEGDEEEAGDPSGDTSLLPEVSSDTGYDIMADLEELREARPRLLLSSEENGAESLPLERRRITIGRGRHNDIVIAHHTVSSVHAEIQFGPEGFALVDKNSTNGTYIDNARIRSGNLEDGAYLMFGGVMALFLHEKGRDEEASKVQTEMISEVLVRRGMVTRPRMREATEKAQASGLRLSEVLMLDGDISPAQWWEASRLADPNRPRSNLASIIVPVLVVLALMIAVAIVVFLLQG